MLLLALRCQLDADEEPEDTTTETTGVQGLSCLPTTTLLKRLLKVCSCCSRWLLEHVLGPAAS